MSGPLTMTEAVALDRDAGRIENARRMVEEMARSDAWQKIDRLEQELESNPDSFFELQTKHDFLPGVYIREVLMNARDFITTRIHLTEHAFFVMTGRVLVWTDDQGVVEINAPYRGVTKPGTRRLLYVLETCAWATVHANPDNETDPDKIVERVTYGNRALRMKTEETLCP